MTGAKLAFIGLGAMGSKMAANLAGAGHHVSGFDCVPARNAVLRSLKGRQAASPADAANAAEIAFVMLPNAVHVSQAMTANDGILKAETPPRTIVNHSTIDPDETRRLADCAQSAGIAFVDCPVGRDPFAAEAGKSLFIVGGTASAKEMVMPYLELMGDTIVDAGAVGQASAVKVANNYMSTIGSIITAEALRLTEAYGVPTELAMRVFNGTLARNGHTQELFAKKVLAGDVSPGMSIDLSLKDVSIASDAMERHGIPSFMGPAAKAAFRCARGRGHGDNDWSDMYTVIGEIWNERR